MKKITSALMGFALMTVLAVGAFAAAKDCCDGGSCCNGTSCCRNK